MAQQSHKAPSDLLRIDEYVRRKHGHDGWWVAVQVDHAVLAAGSRIEDLLNEYDEEGRPKHTLKGLLKKPGRRQGRPQVSRLPRSSVLIRPKPQLRRQD